MKDRNRNKRTRRWLYKSIKTQLLRLIILILGNALFGVNALLFSLACKNIVDNAVSQNQQGIIFASISLFIIIFLQLFLKLLCNSLDEYVRTKLSNHLRSNLLHELFQKNFLDINKYHSGEILNRMFSDVQVITEGITELVPSIVNLLTRLVGAVAILIVLDKTFTLVFLTGGVILFLLTALLRGQLKSLHKTVQEKEDSVRSFLQEMIENFLIIKVFSAEEKVEKNSGSRQDIYFKAQMKRRKLTITANAGISFIFQIGYLYAIVWGAFGIFNNTLTYGALTAILQLVTQIQSPFANLSSLLPKYYNVLASAERIIEIEDLSNENKINDINLSALDKFVKIRFNDVSFSFDREQILNNVNLTIAKGDFVSITGLSGSGKSTLFLLLLGIYAPSSGSIFIETASGTYRSDGITKKLFAYVPQGNHLFSGTLYENITYLCPEAKESKINMALRIACLDKLINTLPDGLNTKIGERGVGFSEGQVQRLAIARAILSETPILLLDEATSALDSKTEALLLKNLSILKSKTVIIVTHRRAALSICNKHIQLNEGRITENEGRS